MHTNRMGSTPFIDKYKKNKNKYKKKKIVKAATYDSVR